MAKPFSELTRPPIRKKDKKTSVWGLPLPGNPLKTASSETSNKQKKLTEDQDTGHLPTNEKYGDRR